MYPRIFSPGRRHADSPFCSRCRRVPKAGGFHEGFWVSHLEQPSIRADAQVGHLMLRTPPGAWEARSGTAQSTESVP